MNPMAEAIHKPRRDATLTSRMMTPRAGHCVNEHAVFKTVTSGDEFAELGPSSPRTAEG
jgi:hypothetical protein